MKEITQRILADPERNDGHDKDGNGGDCFRCCLAMLTNSEYEETPHAVMYVSWFEVARQHARKLGKDLGYFNNPEDVVGYHKGFAIGTGDSPRGNFLHCVIISLEDGSMIFDPHPSRAGILNLKDVIVLTEPWIFPPYFYELS